MPEEDLRRVYDINLMKFIHPDLQSRSYSHWASSRQRDGYAYDPTLAAKAKRLIDKLHTELVKKPLLSSRILQSFRPFEDEAKAAGLILESQTIGWFSREKGPLDRGIDPPLREKLSHCHPVKSQTHSAPSLVGISSDYSNVSQRIKLMRTLAPLSQNDSG